MPLDIIRLVLIGILVIVNGYFLIKYLIQKRKDIKACEEIIKKNSLTFYKAFSKIQNKKKREAIYAVYAFCRYADDLADEYQDKEGLNQLKTDLNEWILHHKAQDFRMRALMNTTKSFYPKDYDYQPFFDMIKGQEMDLSFQPFETEKELLEYCYYVAGTVGLMLLPILTPKNHRELYDFAVQLGYGMQITNILRDIGEDYQKKRIYIPLESLKKANYLITDLDNGKINVEFINMFEALAQKAEGYFKDALSKIHLFPDDVRLPLGLSIILYQEILNACRNNQYDVFSQKNFVTDERKNELIQLYIEKLKRGQSL